MLSFELLYTTTKEVTLQYKVLIILKVLQSPLISHVTTDFDFLKQATKT